MGSGKELKQLFHRPLNKCSMKNSKIQQCTKLLCTMCARIYRIDGWTPAKLMDCLAAKIVNRLTAKLVNCSTTMLANHLTAKLMNCLTTKRVKHLTAQLVVVNLVKLHLIKFSGFLNYLQTVNDSFLCLNLYLLPLV